MMVDYRKAVELQKQGMSLIEIMDAMGLDMSYKAFQKGLWRYKNSTRSTSEAAESEETVNKTYDMTSAETTKQDVLERLKKGITLEDIGGSKRVVLAHIEDLKDEGYCIEEIDGVYQLVTNVVPRENIHFEDWNGCRHIKIGVVSDTHIGNVNTQMSFLNHAYDIFEQEGIKTVLHCGDISDGTYTNRQEQIYELFAYGVDRQADYIVKNYPRRSEIETKFITGNHDFTHIKNGGADIGRRIAADRNDMIYLGMDNAKVWITPNCSIEMNHPKDGSAYAMSYSIQKYIDTMRGGLKPNILLNGHHHKYLTCFYRNIHAVEVPCVEAQTPFMKGKRLAAYVGALILNIYVDKEGTIERFNCELLPLYKPLKEDY